MRRYRLPQRAAFLLVCLSLGGWLFAVRVAADAPVPVASPAATSLVTPDPVASTPLPEATLTPTAIPTLVAPAKQEVSTPLATSPPPPTERPLPTLLIPTVPTVTTPLPTASPTAPTPVATPLQVPLPSPAQLRESARLRWGQGIPDRVRRWAFLIVPAARAYHLDPNLLAAVMTMESNGDPLALSPADARGLMQILHGPWDPKTNVYLGAAMLRHLLDQFGTLDLALAAYNAGVNAVLQYGGVPPYRETRDYVIVVHYLYDLFSHGHLTPRRRAQFRHTLNDLRHFADQRKKVPVLARIAGLGVDSGPACAYFAVSCDTASAATVARSSDPFWPIAGTLDPLQRVNLPRWP